MGHLIDGHWNNEAVATSDKDGNLSVYLKRLFAIDAIRSTTHLDHIKRHYYYSHPFINPYRIIPVGPDEKLLF